MTTNTIAFTGHRPPKLGLTWEGQGQRDLDIITQMAMTLELQRATVVISGMALGIDQLGARAALRLGIPFDAYCPFPGQAAMWSHGCQETYYSLLEQARRVIYTQPIYSITAFQTRNEQMVDVADWLFAYWDGSPGGTANCIEYAKTTDIHINYYERNQT